MSPIAEDDYSAAAGCGKGYPVNECDPADRAGRSLRRRRPALGVPPQAASRKTIDKKLSSKNRRHPRCISGDLYVACLLGIQYSIIVCNYLSGRNAMNSLSSVAYRPLPARNAIYRCIMLITYPTARLLPCYLKRLAGYLHACCTI